MQEITFNLNQPVKVKLTELGISILQERRTELNKWIASRQGKELGPYEPKTDDEGYVQYQLWDLIETFGQYVGLAKEQPFETDIKFVTTGVK